MSKLERVYISGPITSIGEAEARSRFAQAERRLRGMGFRTCNPMKMRLCVFLARHGGTAGYRCCLVLQLVWLVATCRRIYMLKGWIASPGAKAEHAIARIFGLTKMYERKPRGEVPAPTHVLTKKKF